MTAAFDRAAYRQLLIDKGMPEDIATDLARRGPPELRAPQYQAAPKQLDLAVTPTPDEAPADDQGEAKTGVILTDRTRALVDTGIRIREEPPSGEDMTFMHSVMCQIGLPRSKVDGLEFERICGAAGLYIRAGKLWDGKGFVQQTVPYGPMPRLLMAYINTFALRHKTVEVEVGSSANDMLRTLGKESGGGKRGASTTFRIQTQALAACSMTIGFTQGDRAFSYDGKPIRQFEAWLSHDGGQPALWPGVITLSEDYYNTLKEHAVPLDMRALMALKGSALAMDIYTMLADRLHRIGGRPLILHWKNLREQFGQEFQGKEADKDFKKKFLPALKKVLEVYPEAKVKQVTGGVMLMASPPPIPYKPS